MKEGNCIMYRFNYDYSRTLWMKMFLARPDFKKGVSEVLINFEQALELIRTVDSLTQGIQKIVYLVGWQGLGHDDCYPEMEKVNDFLKRPCDKDGHESLLWLVEEAKRYHTVVSFHGNIADEYSANASHAEIVAANAVVNGEDGKPAVIEVFNDRDAYKISYRQYWESGLFKKYWDRFMEAVPVREAGTVHLDNFCIAESLNPRTNVDEQNEARQKILDYIKACGIDVTSEYTYREALWRADSPTHPIRRTLYAQHQAKLPECSWDTVAMHTLGRIPAVWWMSNMTPQECIDVPASVFSGYLTDTGLRNVFYGSMHGENIWMDNGIDPGVWVPLFIREFCTMQLPYMYLNRFRRLKIEENPGLVKEDRCTATFSEGIVSCGKDRSIVKNGCILKKGNDVILPLTDDNSTYIAYSEKGREGLWEMPDASFTKAGIYQMTADGNVFLREAEIRDHKLQLALAPGQAAVIIAE